MIFQKFYSTRYFFRNDGFIIVDMMMALAISTIFIAIIAESSLYAREIFEHAKERSALLDMYENGTFETIRRPYGNDLTQNNFRVGSLDFVSIERDISVEPSAFAGTPLCSVDFVNDRIIGSFEGGTSETKSPKFRLISLPINPSLPLTDIEVRNGIAYITTDSAIASEPDFIIVDIQNVPKVISTLNTGPGLAGLSIVGKRVFAVARSASAQLHIIRLDSLDMPVLENVYRLPLPYATATPPFGSAIFARQALVYLGTEKWQGEEFTVIDVGNSFAPVKIGGLEIDNKVTDIVVKKDSAYITSAGGKQLRVVSLGDMAQPIETNFLSPSGWQRQEGKIVSIFENALHFGRTSGGFNIVKDHELFSFATSSIFNFSSPISADVLGGIYGIIVDRDRVYVATRFDGREFMIFNHSIQANSSQSYSLPILPQTMTCDRDHIYILSGSSRDVYEISF